jgi:AraC-like DNA-binding protein
VEYKVYDPTPGLQSFIKCFWTLEDNKSPRQERQRIVPDGCMEMIFHYGDLYRQYFNDGNSVIQPRSFIFGQITSYIEVAPTGSSGIVAARFFPEGLMPFLPIPVSSLENKALSLEKIFGAKGKTLEEAVISAPGTKQRIQLIEDFLMNMPTKPQAIDTVTKACVKEIFQSQGQAGMMELANKANINRRNMERRFAAAIGMSPKQLSKVVRLQAAVKMLGQKKISSLTSLAHENGYYDQAHFIKDFKEFTGVSPKLFFADNMKLSTLFISSD